MDSGRCTCKHFRSRLLELSLALLVVISAAAASFAQDQYNSNGNPAASSSSPCGPGVFEQNLSPTYEQPEYYQNYAWHCPAPQPGDMWLGLVGQNCTYEKPVPCQPQTHLIPIPRPGAGGGMTAGGRNSAPPGVCFVGLPITASTGNMFEEVTDYQTAGSNRLSLTRYYNSNPAANIRTSFGWWRSNYDSFLFLGGLPNAVEAILPDDNSFHFIRNGDGRWKPPRDIDAHLMHSGSTWTMTDKDDTVWTYADGSSYARLTSIKDRGGYTRLLHYNGNGRVISVNDSYGRTLSFTYNRNGQIASATTPDGLILSYSYDAHTGVVTRVAYSTNPPTSQFYLYEVPGYPKALTGIVDESGNRSATWAYRSDGRAASSAAGAGADLTTLDYNGADLINSVTVSNALGSRDIYRFKPFKAGPLDPPIQVCTEIEQPGSPTTAGTKRQISYDSNGYVSSDTNWNGKKTTYENDARGLPLTVTEAVGTPQQRVTKIKWDPSFRLQRQVVAPGLTTDLTYDSSGNLVTLAATDTTNNASPYSTRGETRTWHITWANSLPESITDPRGGKTMYRYDATGALVALTNALGQVTRITKSSPGGLPETIIDPNGGTIELKYDAQNRLTSSTTQTRLVPLETRYKYDPAGNLVAVTLPDGSSLNETYDAAHRLVGIADLFNNQVNVALDGLGNSIKTTVSRDKTTSFTHSARFDALGRLLEDIGASAQTTQYSYDSNGNPTRITDPMGGATTQVFDALDRLSRITDALGGITTIAYDPQDNPIKVTDPNGNSTLYTYDGFDEVIGVQSPDSGDTVFFYDANGNLVKRVRIGVSRSTEIVTTWTYDALNRVTQRIHRDDPAEKVSYVYDEPTASFGIGRVTKLTDAGGTVRFNYDERGDVLSEIRTSSALSTRYTYDAASRVHSITYPSGARVEYGRDKMGRITGIAVTPPNVRVALTVVSGITYEPFGPPSGFNFGNRIGENRAFDLDYRLTDITDTSTAARRFLNYDYDRNGNVLSIRDSVPDGSESFAYDGLNRLTSASGFYGVLNYRYDPVGNLIGESNSGVALNLAYAPGTNRLNLVSAGGKTIRQFTYTPTGNVATDRDGDKHLTLAYNQDDRLASVAVENGGPSATYQYFYDAFGQRVHKQKQGRGPSTMYHYDDAGRLLEETDSTSGGAKLLADYIYLGNLPIAMLTPGGLLFLHSDRLGTVQSATTTSQGVAWRVLYKPYGETKPLEDTATQNLRFPGQYADAETGYYQNGLRDYDPILGRYLESDPIGLLGGLNTYAYAMDNPLKLIDPMGTESVDEAYQRQLREWEQWVNESVDDAYQRQRREWKQWQKEMQKRIQEKREAQRLWDLFYKTKRTAWILRSLERMEKQLDSCPDQ